MTANLSKSEHAELLRLTKARAKVAKSEVEHRKAELLADVEAQLAAQYKFDDELWRDVTRIAKQQIAEADAEIAKRCRELGVPEEFRPGLSLGWYERGENGLKERRAELRKVAQTRIEAAGMKAKTAIDRASVEFQTALAAGILESDEAKSLLEAMPTPEKLMPPLRLQELEGAVDEDSKEKRYRSWTPGE